MWEKKPNKYYNRKNTLRSLFLKMGTTTTVCQSRGPDIHATMSKFPSKCCWNSADGRSWRSCGLGPLPGAPPGGDQLTDQYLFSPNCPEDGSDDTITTSIIVFHLSNSGSHWGWSLPQQSSGERKDTWTDHQSVANTLRQTTIYAHILTWSLLLIKFNNYEGFNNLTVFDLFIDLNVIIVSLLTSASSSKSSFNEG